MPNDQLDEKAIFNVARTIGAPDARAAYLQQVCGDDVGLVDRVNALLQGLEKQKDFLESPIAVYANTATPALLTECAGTIVGPYKLLQQIGEGGFGVVYMAEQTEPVRRTRALLNIRTSDFSCYSLLPLDSQPSALDPFEVTFDVLDSAPQNIVRVAEFIREDYEANL